MVVPACLIKLHEAHAPLDHAAGQQTVVGEGLFSRRRSVEFERLLAFAPQVHQLGAAGLHAVGHLIGSDSSCDFRITLIGQPGQV